MSSQPKIGILCNSALGIPSIQAMLTNNLVTAIGVPNQEHNAIADIHNLAAAFRIVPTKFNKPSFKTELSEWVAQYQLDVVFVFTFPWKIAASILAQPKFGFVNFHFGLLPQYRGADAIFWSIKNREQFGGISVHQMDEEYDTGGLIHIEKVPLLATDSYGLHSTKLANANLQVLQKVLPLIFSGNISTKQQDASKSNYYHKQQIKDIAINWDKQSAEEVVALINACNPWNKGAYTMLNGMPLRIAEASIQNDIDSKMSEGAIINIDKDGMLIRCINGDAILAKVIVIEEGIYTAQSFAQQYNIKEGLKHSNISTQK